MEEVLSIVNGVGGNSYLGKAGNCAEGRRFDGRCSLTLAGLTVSICRLAQYAISP
jgi:hypothetical protein